MFPSFGWHKAPNSKHQSTGHRLRADESSSMPFGKSPPQFRRPRPGGTTENSPAFQRWDPRGTGRPVPQGRQKSRPGPHFFRPSGTESLNFRKALWPTPNSETGMGAAGCGMVAQASQPAVSWVSQPASAGTVLAASNCRGAADSEVGDTAGSETCATKNDRLTLEFRKMRVRPAGFRSAPGSAFPSRPSRRRCGFQR